MKEIEMKGMAWRVVAVMSLMPGEWPVVAGISQGVNIFKQNLRCHLAL